MRILLLSTISAFVGVISSCGNQLDHASSIQSLGQVIEFHIKPNTDRSPWNSREQMVVAKIGDTIRIINDDSIDHRLHTNGSPCSHGSNIKPGASGDCVVTKTFDPDQNGPLYDHNYGSSASFWVRVTAN